ncbi:hypothetical protein [Raineyella sp. W15-4]|uniref:hypothetical protein n=1 Tax=Raineyella sp. W15-4 TaxID=3081651 RepID=UPI0029549886|nr:hypothetical protein [Raineyella sp. W15-4]WOQ18497.1 hypothetical protein R0145_07460 [Raineyella sp. W15-4]
MALAAGVTAVALVRPGGEPVISVPVASAPMEVGAGDRTSRSQDRSTATASAPSPSATASPSASASASPSADASSTTPTPTGSAAPARTDTERTITAFLTGYSYWDNTPAGSATVADPIVHSHAGGTGSYADPITVAVGHSITGGNDVLDWPAGTRFYVPKLERYLIVEDTCGDGRAPQNGACHRGYPADASTWLDVYVDGAGSDRAVSDSCMAAITGTSRVIVDPASTHQVAAGPVSDGTCRTYADTGQ